MANIALSHLDIRANELLAYLGIFYRYAEDFAAGLPTLTNASIERLFFALPNPRNYESEAGISSEWFRSISGRSPVADPSGNFPSPSLQIGPEPGTTCCTIPGTPDIRHWTAIRC